MDLGSLLNQGSPSLSIDDIRAMLHENDSTKLDKINNASFAYPATMEGSYEYFDVFIQLLISIHYVDSNYGAQYAKTIIIDSLRSCIKGLLDQYNLPWLLHFPRNFSADTWQRLQTSSDTTILVYLYGLVLALAKVTDMPMDAWAHALAHFVRARVPAVTLHAWMNLWAVDTKEQEKPIASVLLRALEDIAMDTDEKALNTLLFEMMRVLTAVDTDYLAFSIDQQLGGELLRPPFSKDEFILASVAFYNTVDYYASLFPHVANVVTQLKYQQRKNTNLPHANPLVKGLETNLPSDPMEQMKMLHKGMQQWIGLMGRVKPFEFNMHLERLIRQMYPSERKTILDLILADWAARDPFGCHSNIIMDALIGLLQTNKKPGRKYNKRNAPFYAFIQLFHIPDEDVKEDSTTLAYNIKTGAEIDLSRFHRGTDLTLAQGCGRILQKLTLCSGSETKEWRHDCLNISTPDILQSYMAWLAQQLNMEIKSGTLQQFFRGRMQSALKNANMRALSSDVVPALLHTLDDASLFWILKHVDTNYIVVSYFSEGPQLTTKTLVYDLLQTKSKAYMDRLLSFLCAAMSSTTLDDKDSRAWFKHHFLGTLLSVAGDDKKADGVAYQLFCQILTTPDHFEWYLSTPLQNKSSETEYYQSLNLAKTHSILPVRHIGLASMLQEMVRLDDTTKNKTLVDTWYALWTVPAAGAGGHDQFRVPVDWILQCIGLYDQAPALVKQMIERFMAIGILSRSTAASTSPQAELTFTQRMVDLTMLSDTPEADDVFDLFVQTYVGIEKVNDTTALRSEKDEDEIVCFVVLTMVELAEELKLELRHPLAKMSLQTVTDMRLQGAAKSRQLQKALKRKARRKRKSQKALEQLDTALVEADAMSEADQREKESLKGSNEALTIYIQRALNFVIALLTTSDQHSLCVPAKQRLCRKLTNQLLFYLPLGTLSRLVEHQDIQEDLQAVIDACLACLKDKDLPTLEKAKQVLAMS